MHIRISQVDLVNGVSKIASDLQAWSGVSCKVQPGFSVNIQTEIGTLLLFVGRVLS
jgi:hypothetical protein